MKIRYSHAMEKLNHAQKYIIEVKEWLNEDCIDKGSYDQIDKLAKAVQLIRMILKTHNASE